MLAKVDRTARVDLDASRPDPPPGLSSKYGTTKTVKARFRLGLSHFSGEILKTFEDVLSSLRSGRELAEM